MEASIFEADVIREFSFLLERGFTLTSSSARNVRYSLGDYILEVDYDDRSAQIDIALHSKSHPDRGGTSFSFVLAALGRAVSYSSPVNILTSEAVSQRVHELAALLHENVLAEAFRSARLWQETQRLAEDYWKKNYPTITPAELKARFKMLWEQQRYAELVQTFEILEEHLSSEERDRLEMAKAILVARPN